MRVQYLPDNASVCYPFAGEIGEVVERYSSRVVIKLSPEGFSHSIFILTTSDKIFPVK